VEVLHELHYRLAIYRIQITGRLVGKQDQRTSSQRPCHSHALLLAAGQLTGQVLRAVRHSDSFERLVRTRLPLGCLHSPIGQRQFDILVDREVANQVKTLEYEPDFRGS